MLLSIRFAKAADPPTRLASGDLGPKDAGAGAALTRQRVNTAAANNFFIRLFISQQFITTNIRGIQAGRLFTRITGLFVLESRPILSDNCAGIIAIVRLSL